MKTVAIIGGGLAGLVSAIELAKKGVPCTLLEKKKFPFHRVCGEYVSNEAVHYLEKNDLYPGKFGPARITNFSLSTTRGQTATMPLDLGGFGISRFIFDDFLKKKAIECGAKFFEGTEVTEITEDKGIFRLQADSKIVRADLVIGAFGKRSRLDSYLKRKFLNKRSPFVGIKYHARTSHPADLISLNNFPGGYCGVVNVENGITNICYLVKRSALQKHGSIADLEKNLLCRNPVLKNLFAEASRFFEKPLVINEISFETKGPSERNILMAGDAAGMITPLCGNGMAMAIHAGKMVAEIASRFCHGAISRDQAIAAYSAAWKKEFQARLWAGRNIQKLFGSDLMSDLAVNIVKRSKPLAAYMMKNTHGRVF